MFPNQLNSFDSQKRNSCVVLAIFILIACVELDKMDHDPFRFLKSFFQTDAELVNQSNRILGLMNQTNTNWESMNATDDVISKSMNKTAVNKIAFLFLIQTSLPLAPLWVRFFKKHDEFFSIYINSKPGHPLQLPEPFQSANRFTHDTAWGGFGIMETEILLLSYALMDKSNTRFILISDSCIPVFKFEYFYQYLMNTSTSFVNLIIQPKRKSIDRYSSAFLPEVTPSDWTKGGQWFEMTDVVAKIVTSDKKYYPKFKRLCPSSEAPRCIPDEHYLQTLLRITARHLLAERSLTWTDWSGCPQFCSHPRSYDAMTKEMLVRIRRLNCELNGSKGYPCFLVARKFTALALPSLAELSNELGF